MALEKARQAVINDVGNDNQMKTTQKDSASKNIDWVSCEDFNIELGRRQITEYISTWELNSHWLLNVVFLETTEEEHHTLHRYRARWSIPTRQSPIPKDTASVYFFVQLSKFRPQTVPVEVCYTLESTKLVHIAGKTPFREKWLEDVVNSKALLKRTVDF
ncbi:unnamed protein product [Lota lota]